VSDSLPEIIETLNSLKAEIDTKSQYVEEMKRQRSFAKRSNIKLKARVPLEKRTWIV